MPKFARYDPAAAQPTQVLGWYNTDKRHYKNMPPDSELLKLTDEQWKARLSTPFIDKGKLIAEPAETDEQKNAYARTALQHQARRALADSADVALQALENGRPVPETWLTYRAALRAIAKGADTSATALPTAPAA